MAKILLTGASKGIGRAITKILLERGHEVWGVARSTQPLADLSREVNTDRFRFSTCDIRVEEEIKRLYDSMQTENFNIDILLLNAGVYSELSDQNLHLNLSAAVRLIELYLPVLKESPLAVIAVPGSLFSFNPSYFASKAGVSAYMKSLASDPDNKGVCFKYFVLGPVNTDIQKGHVTANWTKQYREDPLSAASFIAKKIFSKGTTHYFPKRAFFISVVFTFLPARIIRLIREQIKRKYSTQ